MQRPERWQLSLAGAVALIALCGGYLLFTEYTHQARLCAQWRQLQGERAAHWRRAMPLRAALSSVQHEETADNAPFSPVDFQRQDTELVGWSPTGRGGDMVLETVWQQVPETFMLLAERGIQVNAFSISAKDERLMLTLQLENGNEN